MKNKYVLLAGQWWLAVMCLASVALSAQGQLATPPVIQWQRVVETISNPGPQNLRPVIIQNSQGGYFVLTGDRRLLSLTSSGDLLSDTPIIGAFSAGGTSPSLSTVDMALATDGGVTIAVQDNAGWGLQKRDANGGLVWVNRFLAYSNDYTYNITNVVANVEGGFMVFTSYQDRNNVPGQARVFVYKFDGSGRLILNKAIFYPGASSTRVEQAIKIPGGYLLAGSTYAPSDGNTFHRGWTAKLDEQGDIIWQNRYDQINGLNGVALGDANGDYYYRLNGPTFSSSSSSFAPSTFIIDNSGKLRSESPIIQVPFAASTSLASITAASLLNSPSAYAIANDTPTDSNGGDIRLTSFSERGDVVWTKTLGGSGRDYSYKPAVLATDNGFVVVGITESTDGDVKGRQSNRPATWIVKLEDPTKPFKLAQPYYDCQTGAISFGRIGGDGSPITYNMPGVSRSSATANNGIVEQGLRNDPKPITVTATQSGHTDSYTFDFNAYCKGTKPPVVNSPIPDFTFVVGTGVVQYVNQYFSTQTSSREDIIFTGGGLPKGLSFHGQPNVLGEADFAGVSRETGVFAVTVTATNRTLLPPNNSVSTTFKITIIDQVSPPTRGHLILLRPTYDCQTGAITFKSTGGDGSSITYSAPGVNRSSATSNTGVINEELRKNPQPITIIAVQSQSGYTDSYTFDFAAYCNSQQPPTSTGGTLALTQPTYDCATGNITFNTTGSDGSPITYNAPGISRTSLTSNSGTVEQGLRNDPKPITIMAMQGGTTVSYTFDFGAYCANPQPPVTPPTPPVNPPTGNALTLLAPTYDCATGAVTFRTSGGNGSVIEYAAPGITDWTTNPNQFVDRDSRTASDVKPFTLMARQNGVMLTYVWDLKAACGRARLSAGERVSKLSVSVLGNPVSDAVTVEVRGVEGQGLLLRLVDLKGRLLESRSVEQAGGVERHRFELPQGSGTGLLLLRASSGTQSQTVKILRQ